MDTQEGSEGRVGAGDLGVAKSGEEVGVALAVDRAHDIQFCDLRDHVVRELTGVPPVSGVRLDLSGEPGTDLVQAVALLVGKQVLE